MSDADLRVTLRTTLVFAIALLFGCGSDDPSEPTPSLDDSNCVACDGVCRDDTFTVADRSHTSGNVDYPQNPPVGGPHNECWIPWTVYAVEPPAERWVHNLEHGGLAFLHNCADACGDQLATLQAFVEGLPQGRAMMLPYAEMASPFAVVAWGASLQLGCVDVAAMQAFYDAHVAHAPESITADPPNFCPAP